MSRIAVVLLVLLTACPLFAQTKPATKPTTKPTTQPIDSAAVAKLIEQLGADDAAARDAARIAIAAMGPAVSPELEKAIPATSDPEIRTSLQTLIADLAKADRSYPTLVTVHLKNTTAKAAVAEIAEQTGVNIGAWPDYVWKQVRKPVTLDAEKQPFWVVMNDLCAQAGLSPESHGFEGATRITLSQSGDRGKPLTTWYGDGFLAIPQSANRNHNISYTVGSKKNESFNISVRVLVDPRLKVLRGPYNLNVTEATDDKGNSLKGQEFNNDNMQSSSFGCTWKWDLSANLKYLPTQGTKLVTFKGTAPFLVVDKEEAWEVDIADAGKATKSIGDVKYTIDALNKEGGGYRMKFTINYKEKMFNNRGPQENPLTDYQSIQTMLKLVDANGRTYIAQGGGGGGGGGKLTYDLTFRRPDEQQIGDATKLIWSIPVSTKRIELPIEFKDLPIPE